MIHFSGFGWAIGKIFDSIIATTLLIESVKLELIQHLINTEIFPLRLRVFRGSIVMAVHFVNQYGDSGAIPEMFVAMTTTGTISVFAAITLVGSGWA